MNSKSTGNARIQLYVHKKSYSRAEFNNRYFKDYDFSNITAEQLKLYNFEQSNDLLGTRKHPFAPANNNDQCAVSQGNNGRYYSCIFQDSQSSLSKHKDKKIHCEKVNNADINAERPIKDFKKDLKIFCLLSRKKDCVIESLQETSEPERFFLDNFIPMSTLDSSLLLEIESVKNGDTVIDNKEHENKYNKTKNLYQELKNHVDNVDCECAMEVWHLKDIVSKLTIEFLINYDSDKLYIFPEFDSWDCLYTTLEDDMDEIDNDKEVSENIFLISIGMVIRN